MQIIEISDHPLGFKRKVEWKGYLHFWDEQVIKLFTICKHYENDNGEYGPEYQTMAFKPFERILTARKDAGKFVDIDGMTLLVSVDNTDPENPITSYLRADNQQAPTQVIDQYDFFNSLILNNSINIPSIGKSVIESEDLIHKTYDN